MGRKTKLTPELRNFILENYGKISLSEIGRQCGIQTRTISIYARRIGIPPLFSGHFRKGVSVLELLPAQVAQNTRAAQSNTMRQLYRKDRARAVYGLEQKTKLRVVRQPVAKIEWRRRMKERGYIPEGFSILYYTPDTRRSQRAEATAERHDIRILPQPTTERGDTINL